MLQIALRGVKNNPFRYLATSIAIILGVAFFTATGVMTTSFRESINSSITEAFDDVDAAVRSTDTIDADFFEIRSQIPASTADRLADVDGVASAVPYLTGYAQAVTADGKTVDAGGDNAQGIGWIDNADVNPYRIIDGAAPARPTDIVLDTTTFADGGFAIGDQVRVLPLPADQTFTLVGTVESDSENDFGGQVVGFTFEGAQTILGTTDVDQVFVQADPGVTDEELVANLQAAIEGQGLEAITGAELADEFKDLVGTFTSIIDMALKIFAGVALFVGAFVIYNTFSIIIAQRTKEMALLRAIGASGRQVSRSVLVEAVIIGVIASALGAATGIGLGWLLLKLITSFAGDFSASLVIPSTTMATGIAIGTVLTILAAWLPARRGARIAPIEALRESAIEEVRAGKARTVVGLGLAGGGLVASLIAVGVIGDGEAVLLAVGLPAIIIAIFSLAPVLVRPVTRVLAIPLVRNGSITGELSRENAARNPKRTATTSLTLMIGVTLMVTATVFAATLSSAVRGTLEDTVVATDIVGVSANISQLGGGLDPTVAPTIAALADVEAAVPLRSGFAEVDQEFASITGVKAADLAKVLDIGVTAGTIDTLEASTIAVHEDIAADLAVTIGDTLPVKFQQRTVELTVAGIYTEDGVVGGYLTDLAVLEANTPRSLDTQIFVTTNGAETVRGEIDEILASDPTAKVKTTSEYIDDQAGQINSLLYLLYGLLGMSVLVALIGIVNTMALSIHERTRELGLLRAVGMNRTQLRRTIRYESALVALMGTTLGLGLGVFFGWLVQQAASDEFPAFVIPWSQLAIVAIVGIAAGVLAGVLPARRAGRLDVLDAISSS